MCSLIHKFGNREEVDVEGFIQDIRVALPAGLLEQIDFVAQVEHRTRSDLIREAMRRYIEGFKKSQTPRMSVSQVNGQKVALLTEAE